MAQSARHVTAPAALDRQADPMAQALLDVARAADAVALVDAGASHRERAATIRSLIAGAHNRPLDDAAAADLAAAIGAAAVAWLAAMYGPRAGDAARQARRAQARRAVQ